MCLAWRSHQKVLQVAWEDASGGLVGPRLTYGAVSSINTLKWTQPNVTYNEHLDTLCGKAKWKG